MLAGRLSAIADVAFAVNGKSVFSVRYIFRYIEREGSIASRVRADGLAVDKYFRLVACGFKIQNQPVSSEPFRFKFSSVPAGGDKVSVTYARKSAFRAERYFYFVIKPFLFENVAIFSRFAEVEIEFPFAAEVFPLFSFKFRTRIRCSSHKFNISPAKNIFVPILYHKEKRL